MQDRVSTSPMPAVERAVAPGSSSRMPRRGRARKERKRTPARRLVPTALGWAVVGGCASYGQPLALRPEPVPYVDTLPIPEPDDRAPDERIVLFREAVAREAVLPLVPSVSRGRGEALNLTHFDDVVGSAWFEHRIGDGMTPAEVRRGPTTVGPDTSMPWVVVSGKLEGVTPGLVIRDARGDDYLLKPDGRGHPYLGSGAGVIGNRLFHAAGYHVPEDFVVTFEESRLVPLPDPGRGGRERRPNADDIRAVLRLAERMPDGRYRALASKYLPGIPKGPFLFEGTRDDDPNDYFHHEYRRELRGLFVVAAWANHTDLRFANTLDSYVEPGYLKHYLIDFASTLGSSAGLRSHTARHGTEYQFDLWPVLGRFVTLGLYRRGWEGREDLTHPSVGWLAAEGYDPGGWRPGWPNRAFLSITPADGYWGAKIVSSFTDDHIRAAVDAGRLPAAAADTLVDVLVHRRDRTVAHWFSRVTPIEDVRVETAAAPAARRSGTGREPPGPSPASGVGSAAARGAGSAAAVELVVSFRDLGLERALWRPGTAYEWSFEDEARGVRLEGEGRAARTARQSFAIPLPAEAVARAGDRPGDDASISRVRVRIGRPGARPATVYLLPDPAAGGFRVAGLEH